MSGWTTSPSPHPSSTSPPTRQNPFGLTDLSSLSIRLSDHLPAPLLTPSSASPRPPTPLGANHSEAGGPGGLSPPTPAPSPSPRSRGWDRTGRNDETTNTREDEEDLDERKAVEQLTGEGYKGELGDKGKHSGSESLPNPPYLPPQSFLLP